MWSTEHTHAGAAKAKHFWQRPRQIKKRVCRPRRERLEHYLDAEVDGKPSGPCRSSAKRINFGRSSRKLIRFPRVSRIDRNVIHRLPPESHTFFGTRFGVPETHPLSRTRAWSHDGGPNALRVAA
jgi:hypothetical protein